jgi:hypothetical protein
MRRTVRPRGRTIASSTAAAWTENTRPWFLYKHRTEQECLVQGHAHGPSVWPIIRFMSKLNLRAAFALGLESPLSAQQIFTNRVSEIAAFDSFVHTLVRSLCAAKVSPVHRPWCPPAEMYWCITVWAAWERRRFRGNFEARFLAEEQKGEAERARCALTSPTPPLSIRNRTCFVSGLVSLIWLADGPPLIWR